MAELEPGIIMRFNPRTNELMAKKLGKFKAICSDSVESPGEEISIKIEFEIKVDGMLKKTKFDPEQIDPVGEGLIYVKFDNVEEQSFDHPTLKNPLNVVVPESAAAGVTINMEFSDIGKTRWG
ncbi:hypothetical protein [Chitinophaga rhizophila]|uniref:Uncharacterized protein n=1 Tax=Chitinophaga rhizophila TaxID=2866212 RepID=A0ABS7G885_9BACT|nr:hypothetical protein [Chitinophaga rhizophila]MBW8683872.1 hypothetical protein [Chitinophaga rhizophila]